MKISVNSLLFPCIIGVAVFSSKESSLTQELTSLFSLLTLVITSLIVWINYGKNSQNAIIVFILIILSFLMKLTISMEGDIFFLTVVYQVLYSILILLSGVIIFNKNQQLIAKQFFIFVLLTIIFSSFQMNGSIWAQNIGTAVEWKTYSSGEVLFVPFHDIENVLLLQSRPDGFTYANNLSSQLLLMIFGYYFWYINFSKYGYNNKWLAFYLIAFACALNGGKIVIFGISILLLYFILNISKFKLKYFSKSIFFTFLGYLTYYVLFPGLFVMNYNKDLFIFNAVGRAQNISSLYSIGFFKFIIDKFASYKFGGYIDGFDVESKISQLGGPSEEKVSGLAVLMEYKYILLFCIIIFVLFYRYFRKMFLKSDNVNNIYSMTKIFILLISISILGGPFFRTIWFVFFFSPIMIPIIMGIKYRK